MGSIRDDGRAGTGCSSSSNCRKSFDDQAARASYVDGAPNPVKAHLLAHSLSVVGPTTANWVGGGVAGAVPSATRNNTVIVTSCKMMASNLGHGLPCRPLLRVGCPSPQVFLPPPNCRITCSEGPPRGVGWRS